MHTFTHLTAIRSFLSNCPNRFLMRSIFALVLLAGIFVILTLPAFAQGTITGSFVGRVTNSRGEGIPNAKITFTDQDTEFTTAAITDSKGQFSRLGVRPGNYKIRVEADKYVTFNSTISQSLFATTSNPTIPVPITLEAIPEEKPPTSADNSVAVQPQPPVTPTNAPPSPNSSTGKNSTSGGETLDLNTQRAGSFSENEVHSLPLGSSTLTRTFDELALLVPGVAPPPQAIGNSVGPGVGGGVGTSGQFAVNGLRSRANNFTVDGSDNNDEDIGVRRQGFFSLVPQPIESVQQFSIITLLAPAEFGRNLGAQVNAISKSGTNNRLNGTIYAFFNSSKLNARNYFDNDRGNTSTTLTSSIFGNNNPVLINGQQKLVTNEAGGKDPLTLLQGGFAVGGRIIRNKMFFFFSGEGQLLNGTQERHFAVPTVEQRSVLNAPQGLQACLGTTLDNTGRCRNNGTLFNFTPGFPTTVGGDAVFSLFPFANDPTGVYGRNTYTQALSTDARGRILSVRYDWNIFHINGNQQTFTARYNNTNDRRDLTDVGGALFSAIRPLVRTDNFSSFLSGSLSNSVANEFRFSWGRTRLKFEELPDTTGFILPVSSSIINNSEDRRFLLNARLLLNNTLPFNCTPTGCIGASQTVYAFSTTRTTQDTSLGPIGQVNIAGFSPVGVDVFNFPQQRTNDTYQFADTLRWQLGRNALAIGTDIRRVYLDSDLPRNSRPLVTFYGGACDTAFVFCNTGFSTPQALAAGGAATGFFQSLITPGKDSRIKLSYNQLDFFAEDEWRISPRMNFTFGLRYEYNTTPQEADNKIESTFQLQQSQFPAFSGTNLFQGFSDFIAGRTKIYDPDRNNFAPRVGFAWSPTSDTVIRGGYGVYYDQIIGSVVSQSRNVFPNFTTANTGGGDLQCNDFFSLLNPITGSFSFDSNFCDAQLGTFVRPGTLNTLNTSAFSLLNLLSGLYSFPYENGTSFGATIPARKLNTPLSHQYSIEIEQKLFRNTFLSAAYVGTTGRNLLRFTTPNLGSNYLTFVSGFNADAVSSDGSSFQPGIIGTTYDPFSNSDLTRPNRNVGPINQFETTGRSRYDSFQIGLRGRLAQSFQYRASYVYGSVKDDVSDVFDLAGAFALPQNSLTFAGEYAPANFDVRHRLTYNFIYDLPSIGSGNHFVRYFFDGWQIAGTGKLSSGQPFTVNTVFDVNFDGNLTDRLNTTQGLSLTGNRQQPILLNGNPQSLLADFGSDGAVKRNSFRASGLVDLDLSFAKRFKVGEDQNLQLRFDIFNFINRANFGIPVRFLEAPSFGRSVDTVTPGRRVQIALNYIF